MPLDEFGRERPALGNSTSSTGGGASKSTTSKSGGGGGSSSHRRGSKHNKGPQHPSHKYVEEPLLCEFVFKDSPQASEHKSYNDYRQSYCLNFIRKFFNYHLDDSWFRNLYSPVCKIQQLQLELERAKREASILKEQIATDETFRSRVLLDGSTEIPNKLHLQSFQNDQNYYLIDKIPTYVTTQQLQNACSEHTNVQLFELTNALRPYKHRQVLLICQNTSIRKLEEIIVDCSDPYDRHQFDGDGRGSIPTDNRLFTVRQETLPVKSIDNTRVAELSSSLSHPDRIPEDLVRAKELVRYLDAQKDLVEFNVPEQWSAVEQLDTLVCYLRRVHLWNFYNATQYGTVGDLLVAPIFYRRPNVTEELDRDDLLLRRLEETIGKATQELRDNRPSFIDPKLQQQADEIKQEEETIKTTWMENHGIIDNDNRARCSFHFCHKLFKDTSFLHKHLIKKHSMFLHAEQAKAHDKYMMEYWDAAQKRPVPNILVDCGVRLGRTEVALSHGPVPDCVDPEPGLWKQHDEKRHATKRRLEEDRPTRPRPNSTFVDVDDMKNEKIQVKFDNIVPDPAVIKKKKKKRKLL